MRLPSFIHSRGFDRILNNVPLSSTQNLIMVTPWHDQELETCNSLLSQTFTRTCYGRINIRTSLESLQKPSIYCYLNIGGFLPDFLPLATMSTVVVVAAAVARVQLQPPHRQAPSHQLPRLPEMMRCLSFSWDYTLPGGGGGEPVRLMKNTVAAFEMSSLLRRIIREGWRGD